MRYNPTLIVTRVVVERNGNDVFDYIERFYNPKRRHSTIRYLSPMEFERQAGLA